jgi:hypothetical protein
MFNAWWAFIKFAGHWKNIINNLLTGRHGTHTMKESTKHTKPKALLNREYEYRQSHESLLVLSLRKI